MGCCGGSEKVSPTTEEPKATMEEIYEKELVSRRHNCTDIICLVIFLCCLAVQVIFAIIIFVKGGDPETILLPTDSKGQACRGTTPYLMYFNLYACASISAALTTCDSRTVCVSTCPTVNLVFAIAEDRAKLLSYCDQTELAAQFGGTVPTSVTAAQYYNLADIDICPPYVLNSKSFYSRCLPAILSDVKDGVTNTLSTQDSSGTSVTITDLQNNSITDTGIKAGASYVQSLLNLKTIWQSILEDFNNSKWLIAVLMSIAVLVTFIYIFIMRFILAPMIYFSLIAIIAVLGVALYFCIMKYLDLKNNANTFSFSADVSSYFAVGTTWLILAIIVGILLAVILLLTIALIKRIRVAIRIIVEASRAVSSVFISLFWPVIPLLLEIAFFIYFIAVAVYVSTAGVAIYKSANTTDSSVTCTNPNSNQCYFYKYGWDASSNVVDQVMKFLSEHQWLPQIINLFMFYWVESFIIGYSQMVLASTFGIWYWSQSKASMIMFRAIKDTTIYHLGSVAFGSLLIAIVKLIRWLISRVEKKLKKAAGLNPVSRAIICFVSCCCKCFFYCLEKFLKFISKNAYIMVAIYGKNFCASARDALQLLIANPLRAAVLNSVTSFILFIGKLLISAAVGVLGFYLFTKSIPGIPAAYAYVLAPDTKYYWVPLIFVILGTYFIAATFFSVFEMAIDTVFLCALKDMDIHDGSVEKPYFMSTKLLKIMDVKNSDEVAENEKKAKDDQRPPNKLPPIENKKGRKVNYDNRKKKLDSIRRNNMPTNLEREKTMRENNEWYAGNE